MRDFKTIASLVGDSVKKDDLKYVDCFMHDNIGLFIPSMGKCQYAQRDNHIHPSYMIVILFSAENIEADVKAKRNYYLATVTSPDIPHCDIADEKIKYYCLLINKHYFEEQYRMYMEHIPVFKAKQFNLCNDILKTLNTFAFEYSKNIPNANITLSAHTTIITHWIIRSVIGENLDMHSISADFSIARAQHYIEQHFQEELTVERMAELLHVSPSNFNRVFKKEVGLTPTKYLIEVRIEKSKTLLRRKDIPITEVASMCGFGSSAHFASSFKRLTEVTPSEYRGSFEC